MKAQDSSFLNPFTDFGFKKLFGSEPNKDLLIDFLNTLLPEKHKVATLTYTKNEQLGRSELDRKAVFDLFCESESGDKFIVELQKAKQDFFKDRSVFYATFPLQEQAKRGEWNFELSAVYTIGILDFVFEEDKHDEKFFYEVKLLDTETYKLFYDKLTFIYLEMPKFNKTEEELETRFDKWLYVIKHLHHLTDRPAKLQERIFEKLFETAALAKLNPEEYLAYEESLKVYRDLKNVVDTSFREGVEQGVQQGIQTGIQQGLEQGALNAKREMVLKAKTQGFSVETIEALTGFSPDEILKILSKDP